MSALFDFRSFLTVLLLAICTCTYAKMLSPQARAACWTAAQRGLFFAYTC
jgi:hypothetical protein